MNNTIQQPIATACLFTWIGFVCAISFMEAWIKFRAPGVTLPVGLGIGKLVFGALNKVEWIFAIAVCASAILHSKTVITVPNILLGVIIIILILQTIWLLPALDIRAEQRIQGLPVTASNLHFYFIGMEFLKVAGLFITGVYFLK